MGVAPTVYRWDDPGVPGRPGGTTNADRMNYLSDILRACLVTGYGDKVAPGWIELYHQAAAASDGKLVLQNASQTGVVSLNLNVSNRLDGTEVGTDWASGELVGSPGSFFVTLSIMDNPQTMRWMVLANPSGALLLAWRDPTGLTGDALSDYNSIALYIGSMLPWGSNINPVAAPNMFAYAPRRLFQQSYDGNYRDVSAVSLIEPDGSQSVSQTTGSFAVLAGAYSLDAADLYRNVPEAQMAPVGVYRDNVVFARLPGWYCSMGLIQTTQLVALRDDDGLWTGDEVTFLGAPAVLVATQYRYSLISLRAEDWP